MQQIADWLESLGMSEYAQRFAENRIDFSVLPDLTDQDLKDIGVLLGHRRKMLRAIAELENTPALAARRHRHPHVACRALPEATSAGERRYLTVMFCDLVDSTGIAAQLDAEEWRDLVGSYLDAASAAVTEMGGHVAKKLGDGLMACSAIRLRMRTMPNARHAQRCLSSARSTELNRKNADKAKPELVARIGLESGPAVLDASGRDLWRRRQHCRAGAGAGRARRGFGYGAGAASGRRTVCERKIAARTAQGSARTDGSFRLVRASGGGRRSGQRNLTPLVGRDDEMAMLMRRWERARRATGQLVMIVGEPGLGKSRLIEEFHARLKDMPHTWAEWSCSQLLQNTPLHPIAEWGRQRFGGADVPAERRLAELETSLAHVKLDPAEIVPLLAPLLDIPLPQGAHTGARRPRSCAAGN